MNDIIEFTANDDVITTVAVDDDRGQACEDTPGHATEVDRIAASSAIHQNGMYIRRIQITASNLHGRTVKGHKSASIACNNQGFCICAGNMKFAAYHIECGSRTQQDPQLQLQRHTGTGMGASPKRTA